MRAALEGSGLRQPCPALRGCFQHGTALLAPSLPSSAAPGEGATGPTPG